MALQRGVAYKQEHAFPDLLYLFYTHGTLGVHHARAPLPSPCCGLMPWTPFSLTDGSREGNSSVICPQKRRESSLGSLLVDGTVEILTRYSKI